ncbi:hypothetical protein [Actinoplanes regularis]|uniref:hypothetical protein n=1 Tax=Actinoplanes regularis TaxID=52697 RepID=UPI0015C5B3FE|nr:hypothetical protein [Actinoplanes regularis]GIE90283.1 hypothetical protein Are01nite_67630 [Actinoplanes regularis]
MLTDPMPIVMESPNGMIRSGGATMLLADAGEAPVMTAATAHRALRTRKITIMTSGEVQPLLSAIAANHHSGYL